MKFLFIVQGEGRGHMTQAISLRDMLTRQGHSVVATLVGKSERRTIPDFFLEKILTPVQTFESPNFVLDPKNKGLKLFETFRVNFKKSSLFIQNIKEIDKTVKNHSPDVIINFYDLLGGLYSYFFKNKRGFKYVCVGHQLLFKHKDFIFPDGRKLEKFLLSINSRFTASNADLKLALSFQQLPDVPQKKIFVVPPLLRKEVLDITASYQDFILSYMLNDGYGDEIIEWHQRNQDIKVVCFWDRKSAEDGYSPHPNLIFYQLDDKKFLEKMAQCTGYVSTAGFESICEAMYMGKPVLIIPTANHYEQFCNSLDAVKVGAGISCDRFNMTLLMDYLPEHESIQTGFQKWVNSAENRFMELLTFLN